MNRKFVRWGILSLLIALAAALSAPCTALACGGVFSRDASIEQKTERVIFIQNDDGTLTSVIQLKFTGEAEDFGWVLPLPEAVPARDIEVIDGGDAMFDALERSTEPVFLKPDKCYPPDYAPALGSGPTRGGAPPGAQSVSSGVVGPFGFDVVKSDDPQALGNWLRGNGYEFTPAMQPLVQPYIDAGMFFLAMKLKPGAGVDSIEPVKVTFKAARPMIPLRLAAVSARPDTAIRVWFFATQQAAPVNFARIAVADDDIRYDLNNSFSTRGSYDDLLAAGLADANGQGFVTDYAGPSRDVPLDDPRLQGWAAGHPYLTRLSTAISPQAMTADPVFDYDSALPDRPLEHNLNLAKPVVDDCQRQQNRATLGLITRVALPVLIGLAALITAASVIMALRQRRVRRQR